MSSGVYKTNAERAKEGVEIIRKLSDIGVNVTDPAYIYTKDLVNKWIREGETIKETVEFPRYGRRLELLLPKKVIHSARAAFKVVDEETRKILKEGY
jgi:aryl-alcohol dehydrogenase-like predicted oxidoreductase